VSVALAPERFSAPNLAPTAVDFRFSAQRAAQPGLRGPLLAQAGLMLMIAVLAAPAATPLASAERTFFPAAAALVGAWLVLRGYAASFLTFCLWLFLATPFVRRVADAHAGFLQANTLMLAPFVASACAVIELPRFFLAPGRPAQWPMGLLLLACCYGYLVAITGGLWTAGAIDLLRWITPPLLCCYLLTKTDRWWEICAALRAMALLALPLISAYAVYQYVVMPRWDVIWMRNVKMGSVGPPMPFQVRAFGSMNSPASLAYYLNALILITLCLRSPLRWVNVTLGASALAVTLVRSAWLGLALGAGVLMLRAPQRAKMSVLALGAGLLLAAPMVVTNAQVEHMVVQRLQTLTNLNGDESFSARSTSYADTARELFDWPWGQGMGKANVAANYTSQNRTIDGGPIEIMLSLGVLFGLMYLTMAVLLAGAAFLRPPPQTGRDIWAAAQAILFAQTMAFASVTTTIGEIGVLFWVAIGLLLAAPRPCPPDLRQVRGG
jgi:hypothetical protein